MVMYNEGQDAADATAVTVAPETCDSHTTIGSTASKSERWYASGNERSHSAFNMNLPNNTIWNGYPLYPSDNFHFKIELMNMNHEAQIGYVTVTYDIVEGHPENFREIKPVWLDAALCTGTGSEITAPQQSGKFSVVAEPWVATFDGAILGIAGHVHDGGVGVRFEVDGQHVCDSVATYGSTSGSISPKPMMGGGATVHVSAMSTCIGPLLPVKELKKGQKWTLIADYDYDKHLGILEEDGKQSDIMGIALLFALRSDKRQAS
ncbi:hypothetical protein EJ06DRAFT_341742 [Trichodelitschia bisporula]|uniref:Uncharacterized protein n=1 Tax=Trichodelitschia bisporula TaxID=703511 RepID=A0A6G1I2E5_9PEZI|nr:hypothetical protein EJ06DRAFT_341742 [Trichodelitschia bisporula]